MKKFENLNAVPFAEKKYRKFPGANTWQAQEAHLGSYETFY
jgi:hypothetical protein